MSTSRLTLYVLNRHNLLKMSDVAQMAGVSRQAAWKAASAGEIAGTTRSEGGQFLVTRDGAEEWAMNKKALWRDQQRVRAARDRARFHKRTAVSGVIGIHGIRQDFDIWLRRVGGAEGILKQDKEDVQEV